MLLQTLRRRGGRAVIGLIVGLLAGGAAGAGAMYLLKQGKKGVPGGPRLGEAEALALVPGEAAGFVHIRLRGLWDAEAFAEVRKIVDAAGPQAKAALDDSFVPAPSTLDNMTLVFLKAPRAPEPALKAPAPAPKAPPKGKAGNQPRKNAQPPKVGFAPPPPAGFGPLGGVGDFVPAFGDDLKVVVLLAFNAPFDAEKVRASHTKTAVQKKVGDREYWEDATADVAVYFPNNTTMALGDPGGVRNYLTRINAPGGPLTKAIEHARKGGHHVVAALNMGQLGLPPLGGTENVPAEYKDVLKNAQTALKAESLMLGVALGDEGTKVEIRAKYKDDAAAAESETALRELAKFARTKLDEPKKQMEATLNGPPGQPKPRPVRDLPGAIGGLFGLGSINALGEWLADPPLKTDGSEVVLTPRVPSAAALYAGGVAASVALLVPAVDKVRMSATRMKDQNNLKQIGLAFHNYHDSMGRFPSQDATVPPNTKGGLSWRVHLLPFIEQDALYRQFKLDEPWDSPNNKKLIDKMPTTYASPFATDPPGQTRYKVFSDTKAVIYPGSGVRLGDITDGTSNTALVVGGGRAVTWTKPDDIEVTSDLAPSALALPGQTGCNLVLCDGSVRWIELSRLTPKTLNAVITRSGGETLDIDW